jgi:hypothetical protein
LKDSLLTRDLDGKTDENEHLTFHQRAEFVLDRAWLTAMASESTGEPSQCEPALIDAIFNSSEVGYKKAIIIQIAAKATNALLDAQSLQKGGGSQGSWDARSFATKVFVPWNSRNGSLLGTSGDPYVSNQFRNPRFDESIRGSRKKTEIFDLTLGVLQLANTKKSESECELLLVEILLGLRRFLQGKTFEYALPNRTSLESALSGLADFLKTSSGGARFQAVAFALFDALRIAGMNYSDMKTGHINSADAASGSAGDVQFLHGTASTAIEAKDRQLTFSELENSIGKSRIASVSELIIIINKASKNLFRDEDKDDCEQLIAKNFSSGLNVYVEAFEDIARIVLLQIGEQGRRNFLEIVGKALELQKADAQHRWAWSEIVKRL